MNEIVTKCLKSMDIYIICLDRGLVSMKLLIFLIYKVSELSLIMEYKEKQNKLVIYSQNFV